MTRSAAGGYPPVQNNNVKFVRRVAENADPYGRIRER